MSQDLKRQIQILSNSPEKTVEAGLGVPHKARILMPLPTSSLAFRDPRCVVNLAFGMVNVSERNSRNIDGR